MNSFKTFNRRAGSIFAAAAIVLATAIPGVASALTITERSIELTSSAKAATNVGYRVIFDAATDGTDAFVVDFCTTPTIPSACTTPTGFVATNVATSGSDTVSDIDSNTVLVDLATAVDEGDTVNVPLTTITNPTDSGPIYARIVTYPNATDAAGYTSANPDVVGPNLDEGSVAISITDGFSVSGAVLESLLFCVSGADTITSGCAGGITAPNVSLGSGGVLATTTSEGTIYTQLSTNAATGAVVSLKSNTTGCGGLSRAGAASFAAGCGITPLTTGSPTIADNSAKFGLKLAGIAASTGTVAPVGSYGTTNFYMGYDSVDQSEGVTSTYGDPIYNTSDLPVNDGTADLTFGANISNVTPAGNYSASLSLIATGKF